MGPSRNNLDPLQCDFLLLRDVKIPLESLPQGGVILFQKLAGVLLQSHFDITLNDTQLSSPFAVSSLLTNEIRPSDAINEHAEECDLVRTDMRGPGVIPPRSERA